MNKSWNPSNSPICNYVAHSSNQHWARPITMSWKIINYSKTSFRFCVVICNYVWALVSQVHIRRWERHPSCSSWLLKVATSEERQRYLPSTGLPVTVFNCCVWYSIFTLVGSYFFLSFSLCVWVSQECDANSFISLNDLLQAEDWTLASNN